MLIGRGRMAGRKLDLTGRRFGKLTVKRKYTLYKTKNIRWVCECDCGNTKIHQASTLLRGVGLHCGCSHAKRKYPLIGRSNYQAWINAKTIAKRCGLPFFESWRNDFLAFIAHVGEKPLGGRFVRLTLKDRGKGYIPGNVYWRVNETRNQNPRCNDRS